MTQTEPVATAAATRRSPAPFALVLGGLSLTALFVPFTLAHGPTSYNIEREILDWDMHAWGLWMGVVPNVLIVIGLWVLRDRLTGGRRGAAAAVTVSCAVLLLDALLNLGFRALGFPFVLFVLAPATLALAALMPAIRSRTVVAALGIVQASSIVLAMIPLETSDSFEGYRIFGAVAYGLGGLLWALLGLTLMADSRTGVAVGAE